MHKMRMLGLLFGLVLMLLVAGCGDDKCASCPKTAVTPLGYTQGELSLSPGAYIDSLEIFGNGSLAPGLDSIRVGDSLVNRLEWALTIKSQFADVHWMIHFSEAGDASTYMYEHGDTATISVWGEGRTSSCRVKILDPSLAVAYVTTPTYLADTVDPGEADTVYWNRVEHADYYAVTVGWLTTSGIWIMNYDYATDTSYIITGNMMSDSVRRCDIAVTPFNGPDPGTDRTNWTGNLLDGVVFSAGVFDFTSIIIRPPIVIIGAASSQQAAERPNWSSDEIVANVYKKYNR